MESVSRYRVEWGLSLLNKYSAIIIENNLSHLNLKKTHVLIIIHLKQREGIHQDQLAKVFKMNRSTVTRALSYLIELGLVERKMDMANRKANLIFLTKRGEEVYIDIEKTLNEWISIITKDFTNEEIQMCENLILKMASNACVHLGDIHLSDTILRNRG